MKVSTVPLGKCVSISVSLLNHHHSPRCVRVGLLQRHGHWTAGTGVNTLHTCAFLRILMSSPRRGSRVDVYLSYAVTERVVAGRGWWPVLVFVACTGSNSSVWCASLHWPSSTARYNGSLLQVFFVKKTDMQ